MPEPIDEQKQLETVMAAIGRWQDRPPVALMIRWYDGWVLLGALQLAMRHPDMTGTEIEKRLFRVGRRLQELICDTNNLDEVAEHGWDKAYEMPRAGGNFKLPPEHQGNHIRPAVSVDQWLEQVMPNELPLATKHLALSISALTDRRTLEVCASIGSLAAATGRRPGTIPAALADLVHRRLIVELTDPPVDPAEPEIGRSRTFRLTIPTGRSPEDRS